MIYFIASTFKVLSLTLTLFSCEAAIIQGNLPNVIEISNFLEKIIRPYIKSVNIIPNEPSFRAVKETPVNKAIREKIDQLKPFLQDDDNILDVDKLTLEDNDETTVIEVVPNVKSKKGNVRIGKGAYNNTTMNKLNLYKDLKGKIKSYLNKETISAKTKKRILKTVDALIAQIVGNQCSWKSSDDLEKITVKMRNQGIGPILKAHNLTKQGWEHFKKQYIELNQNEHIADTLLLFNKFQNLFSKIINDTTALSKRYKINCHLVDMDKDEIESLRQGHDMFREHNHGGECKNFKLCSKELKAFMIDFYKAVNDTAVSTFRNYAAMYHKDVNSDTRQEKNSVVALIYNISNIVESKTSKIFVKETAKLKLDKGKNKTENVKNLMQYVKNTVAHVKRSLGKNLDKYLKSLRAHLLLTVKQDINVNLNVELGNLESDFSARICTLFVMCNGRYWSGRKNYFQSNPELHSRNGKNVYVKIALSLDDKLKDDIAENKNVLFSNFDANMNGIRRLRGTKSTTFISTKIINSKVTRTTRIINDAPNIISTTKR